MEIGTIICIIVGAIIGIVAFIGIVTGLIKK